MANAAGQVDREREKERVSEIESGWAKEKGGGRRRESTREVDARMRAMGMLRVEAGANGSVVRSR